jgi:RNA polymerase sigma-70 factor (ECF subfamily)
MGHEAHDTSTASATAHHVDPDTTERFLRDVMPLHDQLHYAARRMTRNRSDAEDLVQDTLARAFAGFERYRHGNLRAWLMTIMTNTAISAHRRQQRRPTEVLTADIPESTPGTRHGPPNRWRSAEMCLLDSMPSDRTLTALRQLPRTGQEVLYYADVEGLRYTEIAGILCVPLGTVMSRVHRARQRLRYLLTAVPEQHASAEPDVSCNEPRVA